MAWHQVLSPAFVSLSLSDLTLMVPSRHSTATIVTTSCNCYFFYHCHRWIVCFLCLLTHMSNFASIIWYLLYDLQTYFVYIILNHKNLKFKQLIGNITINLWSSEDFASIKDIRRKCNPTMDLSKFTLYKKILSKL